MHEDIRLHLLWLVNRFRGEHGLPPLRLDEHESGMAKRHSEHRVDRINEVSRGPLPAHTENPLHRGWASENVGYGEYPEHVHPYQIAEKIFDRWINSPGHRKNLLEARSHAGIDIAHRQAHGKRKVFMTGRFW